jgi:hypothetical protein
LDDRTLAARSGGVVTRWHYCEGIKIGIPRAMFMSLKVIISATCFSDEGKKEIHDKSDNLEQRLLVKVFLLGNH